MAVARVLREFLDDVSKPRYGYELMQVTGYASGKLYPILSRLAVAGWLIREREDVESSRAGRPVRYTYRLSQHGAMAAQSELATLRGQLAPQPSSARPQPCLRPDGVSA